MATSQHTPRDGDGWSRRRRAAGVLVSAGGLPRGAFFAAAFVAVDFFAAVLVAGFAGAFVAAAWCWRTSSSPWPSPEPSGRALVVAADVFVAVAFAGAFFAADLAGAALVAVALVAEAFLVAALAGAFFAAVAGAALVAASSRRPRSRRPPSSPPPWRGPSPWGGAGHGLDRSRGHGGGGARGSPARRGGRLRSWLGFLTYDLKDVPARNRGAFDLGMRTEVPVWGFRPVRAARSTRSNVPKPVIETSPPRTTSRTMVSSTASRASLAALRLPSRFSSLLDEICLVHRGPTPTRDGVGLGSRQRCRGRRSPALMRRYACPCVASTIPAACFAVSRNEITLTPGPS